MAEAPRFGWTVLSATGMLADSFDIERAADLTRYLRKTGRIGRDEAPRVSVLSGGVSNRTVLVEREGGEAWVVKQALGRLRVKVDWFSDPARIGREALGLRYLARLAPAGAIMPLVFEDPAHHLLAMRAVPRPHENWKAMLLRGDVRMEHVEQFAELLAAVHRRAGESAEPLAAVFDDRSFFGSLRLEPYYEYAAGRVPQAAGFLHDLVADTLARRLTLVHGDYSPKNVLIHEGRLVLLDHEVIHWGDPAFDVGFALTHLLSKAHHLAEHRRRLAEAAVRFCDAYAAATGPALWDGGTQVMAGRHTLGCLLARVAGRSPLEYLTPAEQARQQLVAVALMARGRLPVGEVVRLFLMGVERDGHD